MSCEESCISDLTSSVMYICFNYGVSSFMMYIHCILSQFLDS